MRQGRLAVPTRFVLAWAALMAGLRALVGGGSGRVGARESSGTLAACAGGGIDVDLIAAGVVEDVVTSQASSRIEVLLDGVLLGDRGYGGQTLSITSDSGASGGNAEDVGFREGAWYELYLRGEGDGWKTNVCTGTHELTAATRAVAGAPGAEASPASPTMPETGGPGVLPLVALTGFLVLGSGALVRRQAR